MQSVVVCEVAVVVVVVVVEKAEGSIFIEQSRERDVRVNNGGKLTWLVVVSRLERVEEVEKGLFGYLEGCQGGWTNRLDEGRLDGLCS